MTLAYFYQVGFYNKHQYNAIAIPTKNIDYIQLQYKAVELQNLFNPSYGVHITLLVTNSLVGRHTHTQTHIPTSQIKAILRNQACNWFKS